MATDENRSLSQGIHIPQWMKSKITERKLDMESSTFSPTELDDSFFYIRYPRASSEPVQSVVTTKTQMPSTAPADPMKKPDFSKHTLPCQKFLVETAGQLLTHNNQHSNSVLKSNGTDDGFKGEAAACGSSVIKVAHQMVSGKMIRIEEDPECPKGFNPMMRRGSKSLPSSPLVSPNSSPKSKRRMNKYFTGAFAEEGDKNKGWILSSLLGKRAISQSVGMIAEETDVGMQSASSDASIDIIPVQKTKKQILRPKASELREMNFWSPTSM